ncbi:MAG: L,D-transpeptidase family protein [Myxococcota bacterium]
MPIGAIDVSGASGSSSATFSNSRFASDPTFAAIAGGDTMSVGANSPAVGILQAALLDMGFAMRPYTSTSGKKVGGIDNDFGGQTQRGLQNFQRHASHLFPGIVANGVLDKKTLAALDALAPPPGKQAWSSGQAPAAPNPYFGGDPNKSLRVVVVKDEHRTYLYDQAGEVSAIFSNSVGKVASPTHKGLKVVTGKLDQKTAEQTGIALWKDKKAFGVRIIDLSWASGSKSGEELHGTFADNQMGQDVSHGCVRHYNEDILALFAALKVGDRVAIVDRIDAPELGAPINV